MSETTDTTPRPESGTPVPGEQSSSQTTQAETRDQNDTGDIESRAKAQGWVPKEEFRGDPDKWRSAEEFVQRGETELPILRERNRDLARKVSEIEARYQQDIARIERMNTLALQRQREQIVAGYETAIRQAAEVGDMQRYDALRTNYGETLQQFDGQVREIVHPQQRHPAADPAVLATRSSWEARNPWFNTDPELNLAAQHHHVRINREKPHLTFEQNLAETERAVKQQYAHRFGMSQPAAPVVEGGSRLPASNGPRGKGVNDLPADARRVAERQVKEGLFKDVNEYARMYFEDA